MAVCLALAVGACLPPEVPIAGKACNPRHPCGPDMACVAGQCQPSRCPERSCQLHRAIDCEGEPRVCLDQCWEPCAACAAVCDNGDLKRCVEESSGESWYCRPEEVCLVHISSSRSADCRVPPVQCLDSPDCDCLEGPWSLYPFCDEWETCVDISGGSVACRSNLLDAGRVDSSGDAGICDSATISDRAVRDAVAADGISALDSASAPDSSTVCDSAAVFDSSSVNDGPLPDRWSPDGSTPADAGVPEAGVGDAANPCLPQPPDCFAPAGTGPMGETCCGNSAYPATSSGECSGGRLYATHCQGFGYYCLNGTPSDCDAEDPCVWSWCGPYGDLRCASYGPLAPCVGGSWACVAGSSLRSQCDCVGTGC